MELTFDLPIRSSFIFYYKIFFIVIPSNNKYILLLHHLLFLRITHGVPNVDAGVLCLFSSVIISSVYIFISLLNLVSFLPCEDLLYKNENGGFCNTFKLSTFSMSLYIINIYWNHLTPQTKYGSSCWKRNGISCVFCQLKWPIFVFLLLFMLFTLPTDMLRLPKSILPTPYDFQRLLVP